MSLINCSVAYGAGDSAVEVLRDVEWRIGPGERTGILGPNGAGKTTLLKLITGELEPTAGRVKRGLTVEVAALSQHLHELDALETTRLRTAVKGYASTTLADGSEASPGQLLERLGFTAAQLNTPVGKLSGGQRRRLQLLLVLLSQPNVIVLDEPTNDLDTDMLAAVEDLLDAWPGAIIVVSHDRYLLERVTDQQYAVLDGELRHLPGGVEQYVELARRRRSGGGIGTFGGKTSAAPPEPSAADPQRVRVRTRSGGDSALSGAQRRVVEKEVSAIERRLEKVAAEVGALEAQMAEHDAADYAGLAGLDASRKKLLAEREDLEGRWLEATESLG